ncbi:MAG TPA: substrate-binding domain-containing protein, partial [Acidimicrobiales bacterium]|nr:substrate-binding domain-containing protein [Acidimicrobiales bacterium]
MRRRFIAPLRLAGTLLIIAASVLIGLASPARAASGLIGAGSSFAGIELQEWSKDVGAPPYNLNVNWQSSSSGQGRQSFRDKTVDFAVTDIRYNKYDVNPPDPNTFAYIPVTAGGIAFMYNLKKHDTGPNPIKLSSLTVCGIFTGSIPFWDDPHIAADNPGVTLPHVSVTPVVRNDPAGTNFVLEEYCIQLHNDLFSAFAAAASRTGTFYPDEATSNWPILSPIVAATGSEGAASFVAGVNNDGAVTAVEAGYATQRGFPVASVQNDVGAYVQPTPIAVSTALSFAQQQADGTHVLNFKPGSAAAYNPSTYSYMLVPTTGFDPSKGAALTQFADYSLTVGQSNATLLTYASIGRSLILFGLDRLKAVPGYIAPTAAELAKIPAADVVPTHTVPVQTPPAAGNIGSNTNNSGNAGSSGAGGVSRGGQQTSGGASSDGAATGGGLAATDPSASLDSSATLGRTGLESEFLV